MALSMKRANSVTYVEPRPCLVLASVGDTYMRSSARSCVAPVPTSKNFAQDVCLVLLWEFNAA